MMYAYLFKCVQTNDCWKIVTVAEQYSKTFNCVPKNELKLVIKK